LKAQSPSACATSTRFEIGPLLADDRPLGSYAEGGGQTGSVIDFIEVQIVHYHWPNFNVADSCIVIGGILLVLHSLVAAGTPRKLSWKPCPQQVLAFMSKASLGLSFKKSDKIGACTYLHIRNVAVDLLTS
jgi:hypothetical protein